MMWWDCQWSASLELSSDNFGDAGCIVVKLRAVRIVVNRSDGAVLRVFCWIMGRGVVYIIVVGRWWGWYLMLPLIMLGSGWAVVGVIIHRHCHCPFPVVVSCCVSSPIKLSVSSASEYQVIDIQVNLYLPGTLAAET